MIRARLSPGLLIAWATLSISLPLPSLATASERTGNQPASTPSLETVQAGQPGRVLAENHPLWEHLRRDEVFKLMRTLDTEFRGAVLPQHPVWGPLPVAAAAERAHQSLRYLLSRSDLGAEQPNSRGETALMLAARHGDLRMAEELLRRGAQVNRAGWAPLHYAAAFNQRAMVDWLLDKDAYIDAESPGNITPLIMAVRQGHEQLARHLVELGADVSYRSHAGLTAMDYARIEGREELAGWLFGRIR
ncbi:MAG: ankyrin repeat domain-containing protein [Betaproteobacteria bacterium]|nr:ankyrin repeat domain-containing protein [Betaproteobacteria bacterium]